MQYATLRYAPPPLPTQHPPRMRRNTVESSPKRQSPLLHLVRVSQQQHYAHEYIDDRASFVRAQQAEEEKIQQDMERAMRAQRRNKARKAARLSKAARRDVGSPAKDDWNPAENIVRAPMMVAHPPRMPLRQMQTRERSQLESFQFPQPVPRTLARYTSTVAFPGNGYPPLDPLSPTKRLAPLARFNPFARARAESLSSVIDGVTGSPAKLKRNASVSALFAMIHQEAAHMRRELEN